MFARTVTFGCLILAVLLAQPVAAQTVYKSTMPDGSVVFSDQPAPDAVKVETSNPNTSDTGVQVLQPGATDELRKMEAERKQTGAKAGGRQQAEEAVRQAEAAAANGKEPLPGERIGIANGKSRLTEAYHDRQKTLQHNVDAARKNLNNF
jgi:hypothetical protein